MEQENIITQQPSDYEDILSSIRDMLESDEELSVALEDEAEGLPAAPYSADNRIPQANAAPVPEKVAAVPPPAYPPQAKPIIQPSPVSTIPQPAAVTRNTNTASGNNAPKKVIKVFTLTTDMLVALGGKVKMKDKAAFQAGKNSALDDIFKQWLVSHKQEIISIIKNDKATK